MNIINSIRLFSLVMSLLILTSCNDQSAKDSLATAKEKGYINYEVLKDSVVYHYVYRSGVNWYKGEAASFTVKKADPKTFAEMTEKYAKDSLSIYHKGHKLRRRDVNTFKVIKGLVTADKYGAYMDNKIIKGSHGPSFKFLSKDNYGIDNNQMYYLGRNFYRVLKGVDKKNAKILDCDTCMDRYVIDKNRCITKAN